jgi:hypothetical protein
VILVLIWLGIALGIVNESRESHAHAGSPTQPLGAN